MEGVVLVEMSSGALHYTKSFSDAFDVRHPKTERLNLAALIFALQNFAGSSIRSTGNNDERDSSNGLQTSDLPEIVMLTTPLENMVLATTPSNQLLVVLFTIPEFNVNVAKWVVRRVALNYENSDTAEMQLMTIPNKVPRRFRHAFSQAVDEAVERELIRLSENVLIPLEGENDTDAEKLGDGELFLFSYYSPRLDDSISDIDGDDDGGVEAARAANPDDREEKNRKDVRAANPTLSDISRSSAPSLCIRNMMASTRAFVATLIKRENNEKKKPKKTRLRSRNAVMDYSEPHEFKRVIEFDNRARKASLMEPNRAGKAYGIADVLLPFVEVSCQSLFISDLATLLNSKVTQSRPRKLDQLVWRNVPGTTCAKEKHGAGGNMIVWRSGPCCIFYPSTAENESRVRLVVTALFDVLEPLLKAKMKTQ